MNNILKIIVSAVLVLSTLFGFAQLETTQFAERKISPKESDAVFFTNRPIQIKKDSSITFRNNSTDRTNTLYFCNYDYETNSIEPYHRVVNASEDYPSQKIKHNPFYQAYKIQRLNRGIKKFYIVVGGYGKTFNKQVSSYMKRLKHCYGDTLFNKASIIVFAWATEDKAYRYYNALRKSKNGANDFAIYQHMLDEFMSDEEFWKHNPKDIGFTILFSSMGNNMFKEYMEERKQQNIPLVKTYKRILFVGSVAPRNAFNEGKAFHDLHKMTDSVDVFVNSKDYLLKLSSVAHLKNRMGNKGPKAPEKLPDYINLIDIKNIITIKDMGGLGHDYILTNQVLQEALLNQINHSIITDR